MIPAKELNIVVIGDRDLLSGLRFAGIKEYYPIEDNQDEREQTRRALEEAVKKPDTGIVIISEDYLKYVEDIVSRVKKGSTAIPVIVEVPSKSGTVYRDIAEHYETFMREFLGFNVEL